MIKRNRDYTFCNFFKLFFLLVTNDIIYNIELSTIYYSTSLISRLSEFSTLNDAFLLYVEKYFRIDYIILYISSNNFIS